ncbi:hypothetical protein HY491_02300 [Candidatus Woesearchaeota archaeon]|nr:hypothetical protein [Candidatus Woesearchaeota archaeon]
MNARSVLSWLAALLGAGGAILLAVSSLFSLSLYGWGVCSLIIALVLAATSINMERSERQQK